MAVYRLSEFAAVQIFAALLSVANAYRLHERRSDGIPPALIGVPASAAVWCAIAAMEAAAVSPDGKFVWAKLAVPFALLTMAFLLIAVDGLVAAGVFEKKWHIGLLVAPIPVITAIAWSNGAHGLYWVSFHSGIIGTNSIVYEYGPLFSLTVLYVVICSAFANRLLFRDIAGRGRVYFARSVITGIISSFPIIALVIMMLGFNPFPGLNLVPAMFSLSSLGFFLVIERYNLLKAVPIARAKILESLSESIFVLDTGGILIDCNTSAIALLEGIGKIAIGSKPVFPKNWELALQAKTSGELPEQEKIIATSTREGPKYFSLATTETRNRRKRKIGTILIVRDVTERIRSEEQLKVAYGELHRQYEQIVALESNLRELSTHDSLTGILNRRAYDETISREFDRSKRIGPALTIIVIDLDKFKEYNDAYGHLAGDFVLREFVRIVSRNIRTIDFFFRFGGDEFVILAPGMPLRTAKTRMERILDELRDKPLAFAGTGDKEVNGSVDLKPSFSAGAAVLEDAITTSEAFFALADRRVYQAKENGRGRIEIGDVSATKTPPTCA
ncbi:MAG: diguanylate cyclase [Treponemataceae bacterium]